MKQVVIIAEAGVNHNGSLSMAEDMIIAAKNSGADYIKFQTGVPELIISRFAQKADYQKKNTGTDESQLEMCKKITLGLDDYPKLKKKCDEVGINFMSTPFDLVSIDVLKNLYMDYMKIPSGEITNYPYLKKIAGLHMSVIMSTGMCNLSDIESAIKLLLDNGLTREMIILLQCNTEYPTPYNDVNLNAMVTMGNCFGVKYGYSDHTKGIEVPIAAVALGASVIEKHFTLDRKLPGPDHIASLEPDELKQMVDSIRNVEMALGSQMKFVSESEKKNLSVARKSIVATRNISKGEFFTEENITTKRPGNGISPMLWDSVIGKKAKKDFMEDELIEM